MRLVSHEFENRLTFGNLIISFVGMSNVGKTHWARRLADIGFLHVNCDALIEEKLRREIPAFGEKGIRGVAGWMGQPHEDGFDERQKKYLEHEAGVVREIIRRLADAAREKKENVVIDTTGSMVHAGDELCALLKERSLVVYIEAPAGTEQKMLELYLKEPKPVVWENFFTKKDGEHPDDALARSYLELLNFRTERYRQYADVVVPRPVLRLPACNAQAGDRMSGQEIIACIREKLE